MEHGDSKVYAGYPGKRVWIDSLGQGSRSRTNPERPRRNSTVLTESGEPELYKSKGLAVDILDH